MADKARVLVFGSGSVGTMAAFALDNGGRASVTAVLRSTYDTVLAQGFTIESVDHGTVRGWRPHAVCSAVPAVHDNKPFDFIVVATKNIPDVPPGLTQLLASAVTPGITSIVLLQNGLHIEKPFQLAFPTSPIISAISYIGATEGPRATIRHDVHDELMIGPFECPGLSTEQVAAVANRFVSLYSACKAVTCVFQPDTKYWRWRKLIYNASFNSIAAITGLDVSSMRFSEHVIDDLIRPIMLEIIAIAAADGVHLDPILVEQTIVVDPYEAFFLPSMGQDVACGNLIEFENIVGEPLRTAQRLGVPTPTLQTVYALLKARQWTTLQREGLVTVPRSSTSQLKYG